MEQYSYETGQKRTFHTADYIVCGLTLAASAAIGLFYAIKDRKRTTTDEYLLAGRGMHPLPVAMSLVSTFISGNARGGVCSQHDVLVGVPWDAHSCRCFFID